MRLGYACMNWSLKRPKTFRLSSYSAEKFHETLKHNLEALEETLRWNAEKCFFFFRIYSQLVPFASHEICTDNWQEDYKEHFSRIGSFIKQHGMRISFHPDQFVLINSPEQRTTNHEHET